MSESSNVTVNGTPFSKELVCQKPLLLENIFHTIFLVLILVVTFIGNLLVVLAVTFFRRLRSIGTYFVASLAVSDLLVSLLSLPFKIGQASHNFQWCFSMEACHFFVVADALCTFASIWNLVIISIDRYVAITHPFYYHSVITNKVGYGMIAAVWISSTFLALMALLNWDNPGKQHIFIITECQNRNRLYFTVCGAVSFFLPLMIIIVMYTLVFRVALNQARALAALQVYSNRRGRRSSINLVREVKAAKTLSIVIGCFIVCWFPFNVLIQIAMWDEDLISSIPKEAFQGLNVAFAYVLPSVNSTMNPIIYALFNREFRSAFWTLIRRMTGRRLGAVGFGEGAGSSMESSASYHPEMKDGGPPKVVSFRPPNNESEGSADPLPTITAQEPKVCCNTAHNGLQSKSMENNLCVTPSSLSLKTPLDSNAKKTTNNRNGCVSDDKEKSMKLEKPVKLPPLEGRPSLENGNTPIGHCTLPSIEPDHVSNEDDTATDRPERLEYPMEELKQGDSKPSPNEDDCSS